MKGTSSKMIVRFSITPRIGCRCSDALFVNQEFWQCAGHCGSCPD